jgi:hypothetical protein
VTGNTATPVSPLRPNDPTQLGPYRLTGRIGRGGMGTVFLAVTATGERAAVKVINPDLADDESFRDRFRREVESARRVRRFCTAPVLDASLDGDPLFIVTEYVDGPNLEEIVEARGPLRGANLEGLAVGVATALTAIHGAGVVHRDLKPANVLLSSVGPRVIDFGIARALDTVAQATRTGLFVGTPSYMAPELVSGGKATPAADIFSWGCVMAYAGTGRTSFEAATPPAVLYQIVHGEPRLDGLDQGLRAIVEQALAKDPERRPTAQELLDRLVGQEQVDTALGADTALKRWPTGLIPGRDATLLTPSPAGHGAPSAAPGTPPAGHDAPAAPNRAAAAAHGAQPGGPDRQATVQHVAADAGEATQAHPSPTQAHPSPTQIAPPYTPHGPGGPHEPGGLGASAAPGGPGTPHPATRVGSPTGRTRRWKHWAIAGGAVGVVAVVAIVAAVILLPGSEGPPENTSALFNDDFGSTDTGWSGGAYTSSGPLRSTYGYTAGGYRMDVRASDSTNEQVQPAPYKEDKFPDNILMGVQARVLSGPPHAQLGLWCHSDGTASYQFLLRADGTNAVIRKVTENAGSKQLAEAPAEAGLQGARPSEIQVACEKRGAAVSLRLWINGELTAEGTDADKPLPAGKSGLIITRGNGGSGGDMSVIFDNFSVGQISAR